MTAVYLVDAFAFTFAPLSISNFTFSMSGAAIISAVVPLEVALLGSQPESSKICKSAVVPKSTVLAQGGASFGLIAERFKRAGGVWTSGKARNKAMVAQLVPIAEIN